MKKFILYCGGHVTLSMFWDVRIGGRGSKTDSYNISGVLIKENGCGERHSIKPGLDSSPVKVLYYAVVKEGDQDFAKRFLKATAQESLSEVNQTLQIQTKKNER